MRHTSERRSTSWTKREIRIIGIGLAVTIAWSAALVWGAWSALVAMIGE